MEPCATEKWEGSTVGSVLDGCGASYDSVELIDEPPGKLKAVAFMRVHGQRRERIVLEIEYQEKLFSRERRWERSLVEKQIVRAVHLSGKDMH